MDDQKITVKAVAEGIANILFIGAYKDAEQIVSELEESQKLQLQLSETMLGHVRDEMLHFYLNLADRFAFYYLSDKRNEFFEELTTQVFKTYFKCHESSGGKVDEQTFYRIFNEIHKKRQVEYGQYKYSTEESMKGNLFWEFEGRIAEILDKKDDALVIMNIHVYLMSNVGKLHEVCKNVMKLVI